MEIQPREFWAMHLQEFLWLAESKTPPGGPGSGPHLNDRDFAELIAWDQQHNGN